MKKLIFTFLAIFLLSISHSQSALTAADWQEDLRFLQNTVHEDYSFLFKKVTAEEFDAAVEELYREIPNLEPHEVHIGLARLVSMFGYGHTDISFRGGPAPFHKLPLNLYHFSDGVHVQGAHKDYKAALGARVLKIEDMPIDKALKAVRPAIPVENDQYFKYHSMSYLLIPEVLHAQGVTDKLKKEVKFTLEKNGKQYDQTVKAVELQRFHTAYGFAQQESDWLEARDQSATPLFLKNLDRIYFYEYLPEHKTLYIRHSQIQDDPEEAIPAFYERVFNFIEENDVEKLVLDLRLNGGGNNYKNKPIVTGVIKSETINQTGHFFVLIGKRTFSACQNLVNELDNYTNAVFVGEPTAENINFYGDNRQVALPNSKIPAYLSFAWWQDKPQWENRPWTAPHLAVEMSFNDYYSNRDPVLDAALAFSQNGFIIDPMAYMEDLFMSDQPDKLVAEAKRMAADPIYQFFDFESNLNRAGYDLLGSNQIEEALFVFRLNTDLFPESANAWDSLAEAHWKANKTEKAVELYKKAIAMDPAGTVGENARNMLKQIQEKH